MNLTPDQIFDGHNDAITRWSSADAGDFSFVERSSRGHLDLPRGREGGFVGGFFAIFPSIEPDSWHPRTTNFHRTEEGFRVDLAPPLDEQFGYDFTRRMFDRLDATQTESDGDFRVVRTFGELEKALADDAMAAVAHFEGAEALGRDLRWFDEWYDRGLRSVGIVWSRPNAFGTGVPFAWPASPDIGPGLTDAGHELVRTCDARGVLVDLAHLNEAGFWDVANTTTKPLVVTHSAAHALAPKPRNLTDAQIDAVAESHGVIGITFFTGDLRPSRDPAPNVGLEAIVEHVRYIADRVGVEHVALGSDFDGAPIPRDLADAAGLPRLVDALRKAGFDADALAHVTHQNWLRILEGVLTED